MALTWLTKTKQYFTTKVFTEDRFRTGDRPTEAEYSNLFQSIVFKVHDLATTLLSGVVRKCTKIDFLLGRDEKATTLAGYTHNDPLYVSPKLMQEFILPAGSITSWIPFRALNKINGQRFADDTGTILDPDFIALGIVGASTPVLSVSNDTWYNVDVINFFEKNYLPPRYRICDGRTVSFINPYTNLLDFVTLPNLKGRVLRGAHDIPNMSPMQNNQGLFDYGGTDVQNLSHTHTIDNDALQSVIDILHKSITLTTNELPVHTHQYAQLNITVTNNTITVQSGTGATFTYVNNVSVSTNIDTTSATGLGQEFLHDHDIDITGDIATSIENPVDTFFPNFLEVDNRQRFFNTYFIMAIY